MVPQQQRRRRRRVSRGPRTPERRLVVERGAGGFGFTIAGQRPCVVSAVATGGPAERAGLRAGDSLLAVEGASVARAPHMSVARLVASAPGPIALSVASRDSPPTDTEDTEPEDRARVRRRHPPPRRRPMQHHTGCHITPGSSGVNEILQNLSRAQLTTHQARLECRAVVGYLGTIGFQINKNISCWLQLAVLDLCGSPGLLGATGSLLVTVLLQETPQATSTAAPGQVRTAVRKLRQERRPAAPVLLTVLPAALALRGSGPGAQVLAEYRRERIVYAGSGSDADRRYFGLVTSAETGLAASYSCHVFAVDPRFAEHEAHVARARDFQITCTSDPVAERCLEFPPSAEYVVGVIRGMYSLPPDDCNSPTLAQLSKLAVKSDSPGVGELCRANRAVFRIPRRVQSFEARAYGPEAVANSPQPSNHSEMTTTSSNSDSGIGFHNDCRNIADRILVVDFAQQPPVNRFRRDTPRRPVGLVGCSSFEADGSFLSNTTPVVDGFGGQGRPLNLDDVILNSNDLRHVSPRNEEDTYNYNNNVPPTCVTNGAVYDQVYTESEGQDYELLRQDSVGCDEQSQKTDCQSNESVHTMISEGTSKESIYSSRSHDDTRPPRRRHLQASLDDMLVLGLREPPPDADKGDGTFVHPASIKSKVRKSKPLNILSRTRYMLTGKERDKEKRETRRRAISTGPGEPLPAAASEPDLRDAKSEPSSPFRRWTTGNGAVSSQSLHNQPINTSSTASAPSGSGFTCPVPLWSLGLEHLLADPIGAAAFAQFLAKEFAHENIRFWWSCEQYALCTQHERRIELAKDIWQRFLAEGASDPVNVDAAAKRATLLQLHKSPLPDDLFLQAQNQIYNVMKFDSYPRFLRSEIHADCARADMRGQPPPPALAKAAARKRAGPAGEASQADAAAGGPPQADAAAGPSRAGAAAGPSRAGAAAGPARSDTVAGPSREDAIAASAMVLTLTHTPLPSPLPTPPPHATRTSSGSKTSKLKKSASNASERRRSGGVSLLPWRRTVSRDRAAPAPTAHNVSEPLHNNGEELILNVVKHLAPKASLCRVVMPDGATSVLEVEESLTVRSLVDRVLQRRNLRNPYGVVLKDPKEGESKDIDSSQSSTVLGGREVFIERRVQMNLELRGHVVVLRIRGPRAIGPVIRQVACKYAPNLTDPVVLVSNRILPLDTNIEELDHRPVVVAELSESGEYVRQPLTDDDADTISECAFTMLGPHAVPARDRGFYECVDLDSVCRSTWVPNLSVEPIMVLDREPHPSWDSNPMAGPSRVSNPSTINVDTIAVVEPIAGPSRIMNPVAGPSRLTEPIAGPSRLTEPIAGPSRLTEPIAGPSRIMNPVAGPSRLTDPIAGPSRIMNPVAGPSRLTEPIAGPSRIMNPVADPSRLTDPIAGPSRIMNPVAGPSRLTDPIAGPSRIMNPVAGPSRLTEPIAGPSRIMNPVAGPSRLTDPIAGPSRIMNPVAGPSRSTEPIAGPCRIMNPVAGPSSVKNPTAGPSRVSETVHVPITALQPVAGPSWAPDPVTGLCNYYVPGSNGFGSIGRVRAALRAGPPLHQHPPEFLENLRQTQRQRAKSKNEPSSPRSPPPLPPKPSRTPAIV